MENEIFWSRKTKFLVIIFDERLSSGNNVLKGLKIHCLLHYQQPYTIPWYTLIYLTEYCFGIHRVNDIWIRLKFYTHTLKLFEVYTRYNKHTMPSFHTCKILKINDLYKFQLLMFMYSYYQNNLTSPPCSLFTRNCEIRGHYTRRHNDPGVVVHRTHLMTKSCIC